ncbi:hypothetical protein [Flavobacterium sp.]|uniref:hypothetical protein n=1 Tax=Flavobacterium sp. TaxID=239 RepID=UPI003BD0DF07
MDKEFLSQIFKVNKGLAKNIETGILERVPELVNPEEIQEILDGMTGTSIDLEFLQDFLLNDAEDLNPTTGVIAQRMRNASSIIGKTEEEIEEEISERIRLMGSIRTRYGAILETQRPEYAQFQTMLEGGETISTVDETGKVVELTTPSLRIEATDRPLGTVDDAIKEMIEGFQREAGDKIAFETESNIARTLADSATTAPGKYTRIQDYLKSAKMQELYEGLLKNKNKIGGIAAITTGLAIFGSIKRKEHTREAVSGPPLLPGGNPYERIPSAEMQMPSAPVSSGGQGMSYNVSVNGDQDNVEEFMDRARISNKR